MGVYNFQGKIGEMTEIASVTNGTDETYYYYINMDGYDKLAWQYIIGAGSGSVTLTVEGTLMDDGTASASKTWLDVTNALFGAASFTATGLTYDYLGKAGCFKELRVKVVANTGGANDGDWNIHIKKFS